MRRSIFHALASFVIGGLGTVGPAQTTNPYAVYDENNIWSYTDSAGSYQSFNYVLGIEGNQTPGTGLAGLYAHFKSDARGLDNSLYQTFTIDAFDVNDHGFRPFYIIVPQDSTTQSVTAGIQAQEFLFNDQAGNPGMLASMADRAFYMTDYRTVYRHGGNAPWTMGADAAGRFIISNRISLSDLPALTFLPNTAQAVFIGPVQLASVAPASLPSAATVGAGALVYMTNGAIAYSNGASWNVLATTTTTSTTAQRGIVPLEAPTVPAAPLTRVLSIKGSASTTADKTSTMNTAEKTVMATVEKEPTIQASAPESSTASSDKVAEIAKAPTQISAAAMPDPLVQRLDALGGDVRRATGGVAAAMALGGAFIPPGDSFAVSFNLATFAGERGFAASAVGKLNDHIYINAGVATSTAKRSTGARAGVTFGW